MMNPSILGLVDGVQNVNVPSHQPYHACIGALDERKKSDKRELDAG